MQLIVAHSCAGGVWLTGRCSLCLAKPNHSGTRLLGARFVVLLIARGNGWAMDGPTVFALIAFIHLIYLFLRFKLLFVFGICCYLHVHLWHLAIIIGSI
jgi:hypothetical protein